MGPTAAALEAREETRLEQEGLLAFWFGDALQNARNLWFVAPGPARDAVDADVASRFGGLLARAVRLPPWDRAGGGLSLSSWAFTAP